MRPSLLLAALLLPATLAAQPSPALALWKANRPAFGIFVPSERAPGATDANGKRLPPLYTADGAKTLGANPLLDYLFLNLEGGYDIEAVKAMVAGLKASTGHPTLLVRIPTIADAGAELTRARVSDVLSLGADGVVIPHVRSADEAKLAVSFFTAVKANVWSPKNTKGTVVAMLMIEDKGAVQETDAIAAVEGYSLLSCGIGSLTRDMGGDAPGAETACKNVRDAGAKKGMPSMMTANDKTIADRMAKGYLGLLMAGSTEQTDAIIRTGRELVQRK
ncbi:aldolase/citrate lyase family protein [Gemmatimonas sp.]|uniref:aldolase/citrate lyase family protein n=1 Tax=Gemmatimonas sp. TaxID=1962908 RepID=UPI003DA370E2